jgi:TusA-related sulfurtransferase
MRLARRALRELARGRKLSLVIDQSASKTDFKKGVEAA